MKKRLRKKKARKEHEASLDKSIQQVVLALNGDASQITTHAVPLNKKAPQ